MEQVAIENLLIRLDWESVVHRAVSHRSDLRALLKLLYHPDDYCHWLAIDALGRVGAAQAGIDSEQTRELIRRLLWQLNEESGGTPWGVVGAIGAIIVRRPDLFFGYLSMLEPFADDPHLGPEFIWTVVMVGLQRPEQVAEYRGQLTAAARHDEPAIRAYAAWGLSRLGWETKSLPATKSDQRLIYEGDGIYRLWTGQP